MASINTSAVTAASRGRNSAVTVANANGATNNVLQSESARSNNEARRDTHQTKSLASRIVPLGVFLVIKPRSPPPCHALTLPPSCVKSHTLQDDWTDSKLSFLVVLLFRPYHVQSHTTLNAKLAP